MTSSTPRTLSTLSIQMIYISRSPRPVSTPECRKQLPQGVPQGAQIHHLHSELILCTNPFPSVSRDSEWPQPPSGPEQESGSHPWLSVPLHFQWITKPYYVIPTYVFCILTATQFRRIASSLSSASVIPLTVKIILLKCSWVTFNLLRNLWSLP